MWASVILPALKWERLSVSFSLVSFSNSLHQVADHKGSAGEIVSEDSSDARDCSPIASV